MKTRDQEKVNAVLHAAMEKRRQMQEEDFKRRAHKILEVARRMNNAAVALGAMANQNQMSGADAIEQSIRHTAMVTLHEKARLEYNQLVAHLSAEDMEKVLSYLPQVQSSDEERGTRDTEPAE